MENTPTTDHTLNIFLNMKADVILGKNLMRHLGDIAATIENLKLAIKIAQINNEDISSREALMKEILKLGITVVR